MDGGAVGSAGGWHQPAFKSPFEDRLAQEGAAGEARLHGGFNLIKDGEARLYFGNNPFLFSDG